MSAAAKPERWCEDCWRGAADATVPNLWGPPIEHKFLVGPLVPIGELREQAANIWTDELPESDPIFSGGVRFGLGEEQPLYMTPAEKDEVEFLQPSVPGRTVRIVRPDEVDA